MRWLVLPLCLACVVGIDGRSVGSHVRSVRLQPPYDEQLFDDATVQHIAINKSNSEDQEHNKTWTDYPENARGGELTCLRWTGGTCGVFGCKEERLHSTCEEGYCMCMVGTCADAEGKCVGKPEGGGEWIGEYSIRFTGPKTESKPYLGLLDGSGDPGVPGYISGLTTTATTDRLWRFALTPDNRVRITHKLYPGSTLTIYNNRRRSAFLQKSSNVTQGKTGIPDNGDLWPVLVKTEAATPLASAFQIRKTFEDGGGLELWHPMNNVMLSTVGSGAMFQDPIADQGVAECRPEYSGACEGRQLVAFDPELPAAAVSETSRVTIQAIAILTKGQAFGLILLLVCCFICLENSIELCFGMCGAVDEYRRDRRFAQQPIGDISGTWRLESNQGNFEYDLRAAGLDYSLVVVKGRLEGQEEWDAEVDGNFTAPRRDKLTWRDSEGTVFSVEFSDPATLVGHAEAADGQRVLFTGRRGPAPEAPREAPREPDVVGS